MPEIVSTKSSELKEDQEVQNLIDKLKVLVEGFNAPDIRVDDIFLFRFLYCCDFDVESAFKRLKRVFIHRKENPQWFSDNDPLVTEYLLRKNIKYVLPVRDKKNRRIFVTKMGNVNTNNTTVYDLAQLDDLWFQTILNEKETIENGVTAIIDMKGYTWKMLRWLTPANIKIAAQSAELIPIKHMEFHVINSSKLLNTAVALIFPFLGQRLKDQIHFHHSNMKSLQAHIGENALPVEYGGMLTPNFDEMYRNLKLSNKKIYV